MRMSKGFFGVPTSEILENHHPTSVDPLMERFVRRARARYDGIPPEAAADESTVWPLPLAVTSLQKRRPFRHSSSNPESN